MDHGWPVLTLEESGAEVLVGLTLSRRVVAEGSGKEHPVVSVGDVAADGEVTPTAALPTRPLQLTGGDERYRVRAGDILISARGTQLKTGWARTENNGAIASSTLIVVRSGPAIDASVLFATLMSKHGQGQLQSRARHSTSTLVLNVQDVATIEIPVPPMDVQRRIRKMITLGEAHYRIALQAASRRRELAHSLVQGLLWGEGAGPGHSAAVDR
jgi:hypothetical protein